MDYPMHYIYAGPAYSTLTEYVPAPYLRKSFHLKTLPEKAELLICGLGFYELYINGRRITKGLLAPYISNPDDLLYYDDYDLLPSTGGRKCSGHLPGQWLPEQSRRLYLGFR